ncbi:eukaryotic translation initiation factor 2 subunit 2-like isoform X2 [Odontomachus brunneus]|uniref:eukaryotic translation initiation factor 2 subunit 2-like isoform X2 n=1 Tax=Odontomachus brunneus TaxID=486640 RepID=UPI0013F20D80|nr:eukaryotic translation initiation factor 2 subunit 2-like isoform X2 [Odontomachus brunneus]
MTEEDSVFDPNLKKKKKKKKITFDLDAELNEGGSNDDTTEDTLDKENQEPEPAAIEDDGTMDLENFGKKKKKKKKLFNFDELEATLPDTKKEEPVEQQTEEVVVNDDLDLDMDFSKTKKKKKKTKKDFDELVAEDERKDTEEKDNVEEANSWAASDRDYTYEELLIRVFTILREKNPDMVAGKKQKFIMRPPQVVRIGTKKTSFANFTEICKTLHRQPKHLLDFLLAELGTSGSVDGNNQLIIKGRFQQKQIENVLRRYIKEYVTCHTCRSPDTILQKDTRLFFLQCETCGSRCSVTSIKSGFQAVTGKRAAMRAKTA